MGQEWQQELRKMESEIKGALGEINSRLMAMQKAVARTPPEPRPNADAIAKLEKEMAQNNAAWAKALYEMQARMQALEQAVELIREAGRKWQGWPNELRQWRHSIARAIAPELAPEVEEKDERGEYE